MIFQGVRDLALADIVDGPFDLAMFASGYEERCTFLAGMLRELDREKVSVLSFRELRDHPGRRKNDQVFEEYWPGRLHLASGDDDGIVYRILGRSLDASNLDRVRILIDYSSMSRLWYAGILNWARFWAGAKILELDFVYAVGDHLMEAADVAHEPMVIGDILAIPGCEGAVAPLARSVAVFGLGFEGEAGLCVLDRIEPDATLAFLASPGAFPHYADLACKLNQELIEVAEGVFKLPLSSVERTFQTLAEVIAPHRSKADVTLVPMGPKPHVLASILVAMRFPEVACLRVSGSRRGSERVGTTGETVVTRVEFGRAGD